MRIEDAKIRVSEGIEQNPKNKLRTSVYTEDYRNEYYNIPVEKLLPFKNQARRFFDQKSLDALATTIREHGIRQPLTVTPSDNQNGCYEIVSGERRYKAALLVGLKLIPCIILHDRKKAEEIAIIENIQREDLHPVELMKAYNNLLQNGICASTQEIANKLGIQKSTVVETLNLRNLTEITQDMLLMNKIVNRDFFRLLIKAESKEQEEMILKYLEGVQTKKGRTINKKIRIISLVLSNGNLSIEQDKLCELSTEQKCNAKVVLENLINKL